MNSTYIGITVRHYICIGSYLLISNSTGESSDSPIPPTPLGKTYSCYSLFFSFSRTKWSQNAVARCVGSCTVWCRRLRENCATEIAAYLGRNLWPWCFKLLVVRKACDSVSAGYRRKLTCSVVITWRRQNEHSKEKTRCLASKAAGKEGGQKCVCKRYFHILRILISSFASASLPQLLIFLLEKRLLGIDLYWGWNVNTWAERCVQAFVGAHFVFLIC